ncbi:N-acetylmuramoyl-L-alanine amidase family protein [Flavobacterium sp.]|uniref:N-acetylmuramoyl-L-alanine amidase family protein n=1 Tax=Flavobacterium sp. TaxID=239 RepID=UPI003F69EEBA
MRKFNFLQFLLLFLTFNSLTFAQNAKFKIVLDAGHGGKDYGNSHHGFVEKTISLKTTLKVGDLLKKHEDIEIIYTRTDDTYPTLKERANLANKEDANLFISIHCNGVQAFTAFGTETLVMGMSRTDTNLDVAKRENSVILQEDNYKEVYNGFDPNKPEFQTSMLLLQEEFLNQSIDLANKIENNFKNLNKRKSRGVKQQPIWVLDATYMPSVLIELGFLSNKNEGSFLNSNEGQDKMAQAIADAIIEYKKEYFVLKEKTDKTEKTEKETPKEVEKESPKEIVKETPNTKTDKNTSKPKEVKADVSKDKIVFKVQISASSKSLEPTASNFKGLKNVSKEKINKLYKYFYEETDSYDSAKKNLKTAKDKGFDSAFIVAYKNGKLIKLSEVIN